MTRHSTLCVVMHVMMHIQVSVNEMFLLCIFYSTQQTFVKVCIDPQYDGKRKKLHNFLVKCYANTLISYKIHYGGISHVRFTQQ